MYSAILVLNVVKSCIERQTLLEASFAPPKRIAQVVLLFAVPIPPRFNIAEKNVLILSKVFVGLLSPIELFAGGAATVYEVSGRNMLGTRLSSERPSE